MRQPGGILLVSCYELGHQPLGLALPLGFLEAAGFRPEAVDVSREPLNRARIASARLAALSVPMHTALRLGVRVAGLIRQENPSCHICLHGHYAALNADYLLSGPADSILAGECEASLVDLACSLEAGRDLSEVSGLSLPHRRAAPIRRRLRFVVPSRERLRPLANYASLEEESGIRIAGCVQASRGCLHLCRHCPIPPVYQGRFFVIPREVVLADIRRQVELGATHITFGDPDFLNGPGHSLALVAEMHRLFPFLTFDFTAKIEHLLKHASLLPKLKDAGCLFVVSAVESLSDRVLNILDKGHTRRDVETVLDLFQSARLTLRPSLVPFTPWSTPSDYSDLLDFVQERDLVDAVDPVQFSVRLLIPPGSGLLDQPAMSPHLGALVPESFSYTWKHPDERMDRLHRRVSSEVEQAAHRREASEETFLRIRRICSEIIGRTAPAARSMTETVLRRHVPRLTESWFC